MNLSSIIADYEKDVAAHMIEIENGTLKFPEDLSLPAQAFTIRSKWFLKYGEDLGIHFHTIDSPAHEVVLHNHDYFELAFLYQGAAIHHHEDGSHLLSRGTTLFLRPDVFHEIRLMEKSCIINVIIHPNFMRRAIISTMHSACAFTDYAIDYFYGIEHAEKFLVFPPDVAEEISSVLEELTLEIYRKQPGWELISRSFLAILFTRLSRVSHARLIIDNDCAEKRTLLSLIISYMNQNYQNVTLERLSEVFHYSPNHISYALRTHTNRNFSGILRDIRLEKAQEYIECTNLSTAEIARLVGLGDASYLHKIFQKQFGISPARYRKARRTGRR